MNISGRGAFVNIKTKKFAKKLEERFESSSNFGENKKIDELCKVFLYEIGRCNLKRFAIEIGQDSGICFKTERQLVRIQRLKFPIIALVKLSIFAVAQQRPSRGGHLRADLMGTTSHKFALDETQSISALEGFI